MNDTDTNERDETVTTLRDVSPTEREQRLIRQQALSYFGFQVNTIFDPGTVTVRSGNYLNRHAT